MSNQAHKNRLNRHVMGNKSDFLGIPFRKNQENRKRTQRKAEREAMSAEMSPRLNPSGKAKFKGVASENLLNDLAGPFKKKNPYSSSVSPMPDASHKARIRGNKARGTSSSTKRKLIK